MRWTPGNRGNIDDLRGSGGGLRAVPLGIGGVLVLLALSWFTGIDFLSLVGNQPSSYERSTGTGGAVASSPEEEKTVLFVDAVTEDLQQTWEQKLRGYERTRVGLFRDAVESGCGFAQSAVGPFYCPADRKVYLDLQFFSELQNRFRAPGEFAQAYVIAHEVGHHVQNLTGLDSRVRQQQSADPQSRNELSIRMELQADCYAGVWGHVAAQPGRSAQNKVELEPGDLEDGLRAASAIGDDTIQKRSTGHVMPDKFTHGTSAQRVEWFRRGFDSGDPNACNTFQ
jgi:predicted metalloprotease